MVGYWWCKECKKKVDKSEMDDNSKTHNECKEKLIWFEYDEELIKSENLNKIECGKYDDFKEISLIKDDDLEDIKIFDKAPHSKNGKVIKAFNKKERKYVLIRSEPTNITQVWYFGRDTTECTEADASNFIKQFDENYYERQKEKERKEEERKNTQTNDKKVGRKS